MPTSPVDDLEYDGTRYHDMKVNASLHDSNFDLGIYSGTKACKLALKATGTIAEDLYVVTMSAGLENIDLMQLGMSETPSNGHAGINIDGNIDLTSGVYSGSAIIGDFAWTLDKDYYYADEMAIAVSCDTTQVTGRIYNGDMVVTFDAPVQYRHPHLPILGKRQHHHSANRQESYRCRYIAECASSVRSRHKNRKTEHCSPVHRKFRHDIR